jgi:hypothetical protein
VKVVKRENKEGIEGERVKMHNMIYGKINTVNRRRYVRSV